MLICANIGLLMFLLRMFSKTLHGSSIISSFTLMEYYVALQKLFPPVQGVTKGPSYERNLIDLPPNESYAQILNS